MIAKLAVAAAITLGAAEQGGCEGSGSTPPDPHGWVNCVEVAADRTAASSCITTHGYRSGKAALNGCRQAGLGESRCYAAYTKSVGRS